jgi:hypothetical protein
LIFTWLRYDTALLWQYWFEFCRGMSTVNVCELPGVTYYFIILFIITAAITSNPLQSVRYQQIPVSEHAAEVGRAKQQ